MKPDTMVMLNAPTHVVATFNDNAPRNGAIGEVIDPSLWPMLPVGHLVVDFPRNPSGSPTKYWSVPAAWLIPISGPDIELGEDEAIVKHVVTEDFV